MIAQMINRAVTLLGSALRGILFTILIPLLNGMESLISRLIGIVEQRAIGLLRTNRDEYLSSLADVVAPKTPEKNAAAVSAETLIAVIRQLGRDAIQNSRLIVQTIASSIGTAIIAVIQAVASEIMRMVTVFAGLVAQTIRAILAAFTRAIQVLAQLVQVIGNFVRELIRTLTAAVQNLVEYMRSLVQRTANRLLQFVQNGLRQIINFLRRFVQNLILGRGVMESSVGCAG